MEHSTQEAHNNAWMNGREMWNGSLAYGEVVVPLINIFERPGGLLKCGLKIGELPHGQKVDIADKKFVEEADRTYFKVSLPHLNGWVSEAFIASQWSTFTFLGRLLPQPACSSLDTAVQFAGMHLILKQEGFAIIADGAPFHFDAIQHAVAKFVRRLLNAQTPLTQTHLRVAYTNWVEVPLDDMSRQKTVGFMSLEGNQPRPVSNEDIHDSSFIVNQMSLIPYLDLALNDFSQALSNPEHALIFLSRAVESIENHFEQRTLSNSKLGKEQIMREALDFDKSYIDYISKRANASHMRHAAKDGTIESIPADELAECFQSTANIIAKFSAHLSAIGL